MKRAGTHVVSVPTFRCDSTSGTLWGAIGGWMVRRGGSDLVPVPDWAENGGIWRPGHCELTHEELTHRIQASGGIGCSYALEATTLMSGEIELTNGLYRWVVASDLGIDVVPVKMRYETEPAWAWEPWTSPPARRDA